MAEIIRVYDSAQADLPEVQDAVKTAGVLRQSLLKAAFEGQLVAHDTRDESADRLFIRMNRQTEAAEHPRQARRPRRAALVAE